MATIDILRQHALDRDEAKRRAEALANDMQAELGIRWVWDGDRIKFDAASGAAKGVSGLVHVDGASVRVEADLPFLLRAIKGTIEAKIVEKLDKVIRGK